MPLKTLLFLDNTYPKPYQISSLYEHALGGTETSIVKTAQILSKNHNVIVAQKFRKEITIEHKSLRFIPKLDIVNLNPDFIVVLRKYPVLKQLSMDFPQAKLYLWLHTYKNYEYVFKRMGLAKTGATILCNSETHQDDTGQILNKTILGKLFTIFFRQAQVEFCYNPIAKASVVKTKRKINKLIFISSPNKGLNQVITCFKAIKKQLPELKLYIANPGYKKDKAILDDPSIVNLGSLAHDDLMKHVSESLCVFYPQDSFAETFGLIYAEANACKTMVLGHDIGSAKEVLDINNPLIDVNDYSKVIKYIKLWQKEYPKIGYNSLFSDNNILKQWEKILLLSTPVQN